MCCSIDRKATLCECKMFSGGKTMGSDDIHIYIYHRQKETYVW